MDFKSSNQKCLNNNSNTFCKKNHFIKWQKNEYLGTFFILNVADLIELWRHHSKFVIARCDRACPRDPMCSLHKKLERLTGYVELLRENNLNNNTVVKKVALLFNENTAKTQRAFWWANILEWEVGNVPEGATLRWRVQFNIIIVLI